MGSGVQFVVGPCGGHARKDGRTGFSRAAPATLQCLRWPYWFFCSRCPLPAVALETPEWTNRDSNHHRQSVSAGKTNATPTEPSGRLLRWPYWVLKRSACRASTFKMAELCSQALHLLHFNLYDGRTEFSSAAAAALQL